MLCALAVLVALLYARRPDSGFLAWLRESLDAWRSDDLKRENLSQGGVQDAHVDDIFTLGVPDDRPAYARPEEIVARWDLVRGRARHLTKH
ncbi:hypothetical protein GCM10023169_18730 [Georgenia halophila]|uniref:Uncharacterized protein n=1 Tax=Georgenia halophila TaxID=620889 RepID=A0ABP8L621_9MICO